MMHGEVVVATDGRGVEVVAPDAEAQELRRLLSATHPTVRVTRRGRRLALGFADAAAVVANDNLPLAWTAEARRMVENRRRIAAVAGQVLREVRRRQAAPVDAVRAILPDLRSVRLLDDHQVLNVAAMTVPDGWGACVFDEQGAGKTLSTIAAFDVLVERNEADVMLVVAPKTMIAEWAVEIRKFTGDVYRVRVAEGTRRAKAGALHESADVVVINYEGAVQIEDELRLLARRARVVLAVDESYNVKNPDARRSLALAAVREWCSHCFVLCGTPAPNAAADIVAQFDLMDLGHTFRERLPDPADPGAREAIRAAMRARGVYTRNLKAAVLPHLPAKQFSEVRVELAPVQRTVYSAALDGLILDLESMSEDAFARALPSYLARRSALSQICSNPSALAPGYEELPAKVVALDEILAGQVAAGEKTVVWSFYRSTLDLLDRRYRRYGLVRIDGGVAGTAERREAVRRFQEDDETLVFLGNPAAAGAGITLHRARTAIYESLSNQAAHFMQSLDRIHRRGQERDVEYVVLLGRGTIDEIEYDRVLRKADAQADILGDPAPDRPTRQLLLAELLDLRSRLRPVVR